MIEARVRKKLGDFCLDAELRAEGFVRLWGANGAGKTSLLNLIAGVLPPDEGIVLIDSRDVTRLPLEKRGIVLVTPDSFIQHLDVERHLTWGARAAGAAVQGPYVEEVKQALGVTFLGRVGDMSTGMRERVSLATALIAAPRAILVDEAFSNLSGMDEFMEAYRRLTRAARIDVVFTSQSGGRGPDSSDHSYRMEGGKATREF